MIALDLFSWVLKALVDFLNASPRAVPCTGIRSVSIAFKKIGYDQIATELLLNAAAIVDEKSVPFMGWQLEEKIYWPEEQPSWTSAALILAADASNELTKASHLFLAKQFSS